MDNDFNEELEFLNKLNEDNELFEREFEIIKNRYPIKDCSKVHDFISKNRGLIIILNKTTELLEEYVPYASCIYIELDNDPLFTPQLLLFVRAFEQDFGNGFKKDIRRINNILDPLLFKFDLALEFFIFRGMVHNH
ncbi:hypothetical protein [Methanobrevibacter sp.]|uniref:hypothetical protein n=1 Tax=Methanobrevibacter sp. TaxID=66852 RepID=UPI00386B51A7